MPFLASEIDVAEIERIAKAMANPTRIRIMAELVLRPMSPTLFDKECNIEQHSVSTIAKHFRKLEKLGLAEPFEQKTGERRRGGVETFYRATRRTVFDEIVWPMIPPAFREGLSAEVYRALGERLQNAFEAGTVDAREDRHFTWTAFLLDEQGWTEMIALVDGNFYKAFEIAERAATRMKDSSAKPIHTTLGLIAIESPGEDQATSE